jgi:hypothetical protein
MPNPTYTPDQEEVLDLLADEIFANMDDADWHDAEEEQRMWSLYEHGTLLPEDLQ